MPYSFSQRSPNAKLHRSITAARGLIAAACAVPLLAGCSRRPPASTVKAPEPKAVIIAGWDTSGSNAERLPAEVEAGTGMICRSDPDHTRLICYRVDCTCAEFYDNNVPESREDLQKLLSQELSAPAAHRGTSPAPFWTVAAERCAAASGPVVIAYMTDGEIDDHSPQAMRALKDAVRRLSANPQVRRVALWGVTAASRAELRRVLAPFGDRLEIRGVTDMQPDTVEAALH